jgi:hypothetical protein|tara:strand:+ start:81 stop:344 length:264 start_codon:yes stop_codon:yes gene_type:complete
LRSLIIGALVVAAIAALLVAGTKNAQNEPELAPELPSYEYEFLDTMEYGYEDSPNAWFRLIDREAGIVCYSQYESISCVSLDIPPVD